MSVVKDITNSILNDKPLLEWSHSENNYYKRLGENVAGRIPDFASIKPLRSYINTVVKSVPRVQFSSFVTVVFNKVTTWIYKPSTFICFLWDQ